PPSLRCAGCSAGRDRGRSCRAASGRSRTGSSTARAEPPAPATELAGNGRSAGLQAGRRAAPGPGLVVGAELARQGRRVLALDVEAVPALQAGEEPQAVAVVAPAVEIRRQQRLEDRK